MAQSYSRGQICKLNSWSHPPLVNPPQTTPPLFFLRNTDRTNKDKYQKFLLHSPKYTSDKGIQILSPRHCRSSHSDQRKKLAEELRNLCVPVPRRGCLIICRWAVEGLQSVEDPPGTQHIWLNLCFPLTLNFVWLYSPEPPRRTNRSVLCRSRPPLRNSQQVPPRVHTEDLSGVLCHSFWAGLDRGHFLNPTVSSFIQSIE